MFCQIVVVACLSGLVAAQNFGGPSFGNNFIPCGYVCTRNAGFTLRIDGVNSRVRCSDPDGDITARCNSCCQAYAMWGGLLSSNAAGFPSSDGRTCVCCVSNNRCGGGGPVPAAAATIGNNGF